MALIKSNSALLAFDKIDAVTKNHINFYFLNYIQNISYDIKTNRINNKMLGSSYLVNNQYVYPEINLNISFYQRIDFFNELLFGFISITQNRSAFFNLLNGFFNKNSVILFNNENGNDLLASKDNNYNADMIYISMLNLYLTRYSISYKINEIPIVNCSFVGDDSNIGNLIYNSNNDNYKFINPLGEYFTLDKYLVSSFYQSTNLKPGFNIVYQMLKFGFSTNFSNSQLLGPQINTLIDGLIDSLELSFDFNRQTFYSFFNSKNYPDERKLLSPIIGKIKISGKSNNFNKETLSSFFNLDKKFSMRILLGDTSSDDSASTELILDNLNLDNFSYSLDVNNMLIYSIDCTMQVGYESNLQIDRIKLRKDLSSRLIANGGEYLLSYDRKYIMNS